MHRGWISRNSLIISLVTHKDLLHTKLFPLQLNFLGFVTRSHDRAQAGIKFDLVFQAQRL